MGVIRLSAGMSPNHEVKNADVKLSYRIASDGAYTLGLILVICQWGPPSVILGGPRKEPPKSILTSLYSLFSEKSTSNQMVM